LSHPRCLALVTVCPKETGQCREAFRGQRECALTLYHGSRFEVFEHGGNRHTKCCEKNHAPLSLPGTLATAGHCDQSRVAMF